MQGTQEQYDAMKSLYPHYVPTYRALKNQGSVWSFSPNGMAARDAVRSAKGSTLDLNTVGDNIERQIQSIVKAARMAEMFSNLYSEVLDNTDGVENYAVLPYDRSAVTGAMLAEQQDVYSDEEFSEEKQIMARTFFKGGNGYVWSGYFHGEKRTLRISERMFESLRSVTNTDSKVISRVAAIGSKATAPMKTAITGISIPFAVRNISRDFTTALVNSVAGIKFPKYYAMAVTKIFGQNELSTAIAGKIMKILDSRTTDAERESLIKSAVRTVENARVKGSKEWRDFVALGGTGATYARAETGFLWNKNAKNKIKAGGQSVLNFLGAFNEITESVTRFAEYLATINKYGDTAEGRARGIKNAAEVTVDFSRHGKIGKAINAWALYWNPGIRGISKVYRSIRFPGEGNKMVGAAAWLQRGKVAMRGAVLVGIVPRILQFALNSLIPGARDDWDELTDRVKDTYFLIPIGDGKFIKIPYNRDWGQLFGSTFSRIVQGAQGREDNWRDFWDSVIKANFDPAPNFIGLTQWKEIATNEDFAGRAIVPYSMKDVALTEQYTEETSWIAKQLAKTKVMEAIGLSPIQIDYLISGYFGDYGDMLIEATDKDGVKGIGDFFTSVIGNSFTADNAYSSLTMGRYYDLRDKLNEEVETMKFKDPESYQEAFEYQVQAALDSDYGHRITELNKIARETTDEDEKRAIKFQLQDIAKEAMEFYDRCMSGEIKDPVRYVKYDQYGDLVRDTLISLWKFENDVYDYQYTPSSSAPKIGDHQNSEEEKDRYNEIYTDNYTMFATNVIETEKFKSASPEERVILLEGARELAGFYAKKEWAAEFGLKAINKYGKVTYDPETATTASSVMFDGGIPIEKVSEILYGISELWPEKDAESVT